jgi:hypothetical protein
MYGAFFPSLRNAHVNWVPGSVSGARTRELIARGELILAIAGDPAVAIQA